MNDEEKIVEDLAKILDAYTDALLEYESLTEDLCRHIRRENELVSEALSHIGDMGDDYQLDRDWDGFTGSVARLSASVGRLVQAIEQIRAGLLRKGMVIVQARRGRRRRERDQRRHQSLAQKKKRLNPGS